MASMRDAAKLPIIGRPPAMRNVATISEEMSANPSVVPRDMPIP